MGHFGIGDVIDAHDLSVTAISGYFGNHRVPGQSVTLGPGM